MGFEGNSQTVVRPSARGEPLGNSMSPEAEGWVIPPTPGPIWKNYLDPSIQGN